MEKIIYSKNILDYFDDLVYVLFNNNYFLYLDNADMYLEKLVYFVSNSIATFPHKKTPQELLHFGEKYIFYKPNKRTTWYVFFNQYQEKYLITGILNNHCEEAKFI